MMKTLLTTAVMLCTMSIASSQTNTLFKNINLRAKELNHNLNDLGDSLILQSERLIYKVEIFNDNYDQTIEVDSKSIKIPLQKLPLGRFIVETKLEDKLIIMTLLREDKAHANTLNDLKNRAKLDTKNPKEMAEDQLMNFSHNENKVQKLPKYADATTLNKIAKSYWVEYIISNGNSSYKTLRFASKSLVDQMIAKNKIEIQSVKGKLNDLTIWEIYDTTKFLRFKRLNPDFAQANESEYFNVKPYYASQDVIAGI